MDNTTYHPALILGMILKRSAAQLQTRHGFVGLIDMAHNSVLVEFGIGIGEYYFGEWLSPYEGIVGRVLQHRAPQMITHYPQWSGRFTDGLSRAHPPIGTIVAAPVILHNTIVGMLVFIFDEQAPPHEMEIFKQVTQAGEHASAVLSDLDKIVDYPPLLIMPPHDDVSPDGADM